MFGYGLGDGDGYELMLFCSNNGCILTCALFMSEMAQKVLDRKLGYQLV